MSSSQHNRSVDADMESLFDFTGGFQSPASTSPSTIDPMSALIAPEHVEENQVFSGPSHEYGRFRQQTGLPAGAVSNVAALNDMNSNMDFMPQDLTSGHSRFSSMDMGYNSGINFDMDFEQTPNSALPAYFFPGSNGNSNNFDEFMEPSPSTAVEPPQQPARMWPGMHSQQAQQAKAEAIAKQQRQQQQGQQLMQQRHQSQQYQPTDTQQTHGKHKRRMSSQTQTDPATDERISRILDQMRHNSAAGSIEEEEEANAENSLSTRLRKNEEDMDEDERLLASEEGKKLSSKERRQLRNKVSARAFRSRRKEYISQLEGEVAAKNNECTDLKITNRKLTDENNQLKHLTRTLLSHPAFQSFLEDLSRDPTFIAPQPGEVGGAGALNEDDSSGDKTPKQEHVREENQMQVNAVNMPPNPLDMSMLNLGNNHWGSSNTGFSYQQPQVFSVIELPQGPSMQELMAPSILSGKAEMNEEEYGEDESRSKDTVLEFPKIPTSLTAEPEVCTPGCSVSMPDSSAPLYDDITSDCPPTTSSDTSTPHHCQKTTSPPLQYSLNIKSNPHFRLKTVTTQNLEEAIQQINEMFDTLLPLDRKMKRLTSHLTKRQ